MEEKQLPSMATQADRGIYILCMGLLSVIILFRSCLTVLKEKIKHVPTDVSPVTPLT